MTGKPTLAVFGAQPRFATQLSVGQRFRPDWDRYERAVRDIFERRFYTSQRFAGPLIVELQRRLQEFLGVKHVIVLRNATNGLMIATHTLGLRGRVIVPAWTHVATIQALAWSKCEPVYCDIDPISQQMSADSVKRLLDAGGITGILGVHLWGGAAPVEVLQGLAQEFGVPLYYDAAHAFGVETHAGAIGRYGRAEVFSFHASNVLGIGEGGCIATNDDVLAAKFVAMRGDEVAPANVSMQSATARMSEIQAAIALMMLDDFGRNRRANEQQYLQYEQGLSGFAGIRLLKPSGVVQSNFQNLVCVVDETRFGLSRDDLLAVLRADNVLARRDFHASIEANDLLLAGAAMTAGQLRSTKAAARNTFQLPIGGGVSLNDVERVCELVGQAHAHAPAIRSAAISPVTAN